MSLCTLGHRCRISALVLCRDCCAMQAVQQVADMTLMDCRIHRSELSRVRQYGVQVFVLLGAVLAMVIVHANVVTLIHAGHAKPSQQS